VLLGAGGLVRAYTKGAKVAIDSGIIVDKNLFYNVSFKIDYTLLGKIDNELLKNNIIIVDKIYEDQVLFKLITETEKLEYVEAVVSEITSGKTEIIVGHAKYQSVRDGKLID
jgi:putative IMPACT (imprinted ancient) family translation regulator